MKTKILARLTPKQKRQLRFGLIALAVSGGAFATLGSQEPERIRTTPVSLVLPLANTRVASLDEDTRGIFHEEKVQRGDTLGSLLSRLGVADANAFKSARIEIGAGEAPTAWKSVATVKKSAGPDVALAEIPAAAFSGSSVWQLRVVVNHGNGATREARFKLSLN